MHFQNNQLSPLVGKMVEISEIAEEYQGKKCRI